MCVFSRQLNALKGHNMIAQGNALGIDIIRAVSPERA
jgi:hypothetical protein